ncbi:hypothetical protein BGW42_005682 [Actinomortierella wolfii]|nr:hypothetical protein BGW42_005682 [Actinomortierella wolfii]
MSFAPTNNDTHSISPPDVEEIKNNGNGEIDEVYQADVLRQLQVDWLHRREYASLRLRVMDGDTTDSDSDESDDGDDADKSKERMPQKSIQTYYLMEQFLIADSYVFRDLFKLLKRGVDLSMLESDDRFACLRIDHLPLNPVEASPSPLSQDSAMAGPSPLPGILPTPVPLSDEQLPLITLFLPYPDLFDHLIRLIYSPQHDIENWACKTLSPSTLGKIFLNMCCLECRPELLKSCLRYFAQIQENSRNDPTACAILQGDQESFQQMKRSYEAALHNHLL